LEESRVSKAMISPPFRRQVFRPRSRAGGGLG
jgi:hypothetical protein